MSTNKNFVWKTLYNTSLVVVVSILTKVVNLVCNIFLARKISKDSYGLTKVYLEFAFMLLIYFPRETIRKTAQKFCPHHDNEELENNNFKQAVQLNWLLNFIFMMLSYPLFASFIFFSGDSLLNAKIHLIIYILAANIELVVEPIIIYLNVKIENSNKLLAVTVGNYTRVMSSVLFAYLFGCDLWAFTLSRVLSSSLYVLTLLYIGIFKFKLDWKSLCPDFKKIYNITRELIFKQSGTSCIDPSLKEIFNSFVKTNILKMILTYTEKMILSFYLDLSEAGKGEYSFVVDNFAIIIRFFLEPIEESFYNLINKLKNKRTKKEEIIEEEIDNSHSFIILQVSVRFMFIFGMLLICYIFVVGKEAISLVFTEKWGTPSTVRILKCYSIYVAIISINGIIEAYSNAIYSSDRMNTYNSFMIVNSILLIFLSIVFSKYDIVGLIAANAIMMVIRISANTYLNLSQMHGKNVGVYEIVAFFRNCFINYMSIIVTLICIITFTYLRDIIFIKSNLFFTVFSAGLCFITNCLLIFFVERKNFKEVLRTHRM